MYKHIIWDFDGTLVDTYPQITEAFILALKEYNIEAEYSSLITLLRASVSETVKKYVKDYKLKIDFIGNLQFYYNERVFQIPLIDDADVICKWVFQTKRKNYIYTHNNASILKLLDHHKLSEYFTHIITSDDGFERKPDPEAFLYLLEKYNINIKETLVIGDRYADIDAANNAGIKGCLYNIDPKSHYESASYNINGLNELFKIIG